MPKQMQLDLRGDVFLRELNLFEMLYGARCVDGAAWKDTQLPEDVQSPCTREGWRTESGTNNKASRSNLSRYQALPPSTERVQ